MISSWSTTRTAMGVPQPTLASRRVRHTCLPVRVSNAATKASRDWS
jgi:hypothetical protein